MSGKNGSKECGDKFSWLGRHIVVCMFSKRFQSKHLIELEFMELL